MPLSTSACQLVRAAWASLLVVHVFLRWRRLFVTGSGPRSTITSHLTLPPSSSRFLILPCATVVSPSLPALWPAVVPSYAHGGPCAWGQADSPAPCACPTPSGLN